VPSYQIEEMFQKGEGGLEGFIDHFDPTVQVTVVGHDHHLVGESNGLDALQNDHFAQIADMTDFSKSNKLDIVRVICGGESSWACVKVVAIGKSRSRLVPYRSCL